MKFGIFKHNITTISIEDSIIKYFSIQDYFAEKMLDEWTFYYLKEIIEYEF